MTWRGVATGGYVGDYPGFIGSWAREYTGPRLAEVPGLGVDSAQQIIAEVGADATTVASPQQLASWVGACPGKEESAGVSSSQHSPKGNRQMRRRLNQAANAAVKTKGRLFQLVYRRLVPRLGHAQAIGAIAHRLCRLIWKILHDGVRYVERGPAVSRARTERRAAKMIRELRSLGYRVDLLSSPLETPASTEMFFDPGSRNSRRGCRRDGRRDRRPAATLPSP